MTRWARNARGLDTYVWIVLVGFLLASVGGEPAAADPVKDAQWQLEYLHVADAQRISQGGGVVVGVIDSGVDATHPDLAGSVLPGLTLTSVGGDGRRDDEGHGTAMAGLIAAHGRALGIAPSAKILPVRKTDLLGFGFEGGVRWAVDHNATVLCLAYGGEFNEQGRADVQYAIDHDVVVVAAVANTTQPGDYPVAYPGVVGAAGIDRNGDHAPISVISPYATLAAPAVAVGSTNSLTVAGSNGYRLGTGTSDATAIIAGAAALVRAKFPRLSAVEVIHRLTATADDKGTPGRDDEYGYGVINLVKALTADIPQLTPSATPAGQPTAALPQPPGPDHTRTWTVLGALAILAALGAAAAITGFLRLRGRQAE